MTSDQPHVPGEDLNDPKAKPADVADDRERRRESRQDEPLTGGDNDIAGHTPKVPGAQ
ncbi:hypothetical protein [Pseudomonas sp. NFR16]|uniref:hypothetical protein n=1 Tax=Pseudomonas sp. NFR16 TaxID=1566248 RepID=UPI0008CE4620|nr:hypothetical protein [Pseudomonas sp. NFR16]SEI61983.1 hypothetical protein SAMN03159495_1066 [Pseudomonas sp. NFR16]